MMRIDDSDERDLVGLWANLSVGRPDEFRPQVTPWLAGAKPAATPAFECFQFCACRTSVQAEPSFKRFSERDCVPAFFLGKKD